MKKINVTFSLPEEIHKKLQALVGRRKMSAFVAQAIDKELEKQIHALKQAYIEAEADADRQKVVNDWAVLGMEGW